MNLVCPHCQKLLTVPDQNAGQMTSCTSCNQKFLVPSLPQPSLLPPLPLDLPNEISLTPEPPAPAPKAEAQEQGAHEEPAYKVAPEPEKPKPLFSTHEKEEIAKTSAKVPPPTAPPFKPAPSPPPVKPPPGDYEHTRSLTLNPRALPIMVTIAVVLLFFLWFFPWAGVYPGGYGVYTQNFWQILSGGHSTDQVGHEAFGEVKPFEDIGGNWLMLIYFLAIILAIVLVVAPLVKTKTSVQLPPAVQQLWPWRLALLGGALLVAFLILLLQSWIGFGIEKASAAQVNGALEKGGADAKTPEKQEKLNIQRGVQLGRLGLQRTVWYRLVLLFHIVALASVGLELWLEKRGTRPLPRVDFHW